MKVPKNVGVLGGGTMGAGIAFSFAQAGAKITLVERDQVSVVAARERVESAIARAVAKGTSPVASIEKFTFSTDYTRRARSGLRGCCP